MMAEPTPREIFETIQCGDRGLAALLNAGTHGMDGSAHAHDALRAYTRARVALAARLYGAHFSSAERLRLREPLIEAARLTRVEVIGETTTQTAKRLHRIAGMIEDVAPELGVPLAALATANPGIGRPAKV